MFWDGCCALGNGFCVNWSAAAPRWKSRSESVQVLRCNDVCDVLFTNIAAAEDGAEDGRSPDALAWRSPKPGGSIYAWIMRSVVECGYWAEAELPVGPCCCGLESPRAGGAQLCFATAKPAVGT